MHAKRYQTAPLQISFENTNRIKSITLTQIKCQQLTLNSLNPRVYRTPKFAFTLRGNPIGFPKITLGVAAIS